MSGDYLKNPLGNLPLPDPSLFDPEKFGISPHLSDAGPETQDRDVRKDSDRLASTVGGGEKAEDDASRSTRGSGIFGSEPLQKKDDDGPSILLGATVISAAGYSLYSYNRSQGNSGLDRSIEIRVQGGLLDFSVRGRMGSGNIGVANFQKISGAPKGFKGPKVEYLDLTEDHPHYAVISASSPRGGNLARLTYEGKASDYHGCVFVVDLALRVDPGSGHEHVGAVDVQIMGNNPRTDNPWGDEFYFTNQEGNSFDYLRGGRRTEIFWQPEETPKLLGGDSGIRRELIPDPLERPDRVLLRHNGDIVELQAQFADDGSLRHVHQEPVAVHRATTDGGWQVPLFNTNLHFLDRGSRLEMAYTDLPAELAVLDQNRLILGHQNGEAYVIFRVGDELILLVMTQREFAEQSARLAFSSLQPVLFSEEGQEFRSVALPTPRDVSRHSEHRVLIECGFGVIAMDLPIRLDRGEFSIDWEAARARYDYFTNPIFSNETDTVPVRLGFHEGRPVIYLPETDQALVIQNIEFADMDYAEAHLLLHVAEGPEMDLSFETRELSLSSDQFVTARREAPAKADIEEALRRIQERRAQADVARRQERQEKWEAEVSEAGQIIDSLRSGVSTLRDTARDGEFPNLILPLSVVGARSRGSTGFTARNVTEFQLEYLIQFTTESGYHVRLICLGFIDGRTQKLILKKGSILYVELCQNQEGKPKEIILGNQNSFFIQEDGIKIRLDIILNINSKAGSEIGLSIDAVRESKGHIKRTTRLRLRPKPRPKQAERGLHRLSVETRDLLGSISSGEAGSFGALLDPEIGARLRREICRLDRIGQATLPNIMSLAAEAAGLLASQEEPPAVESEPEPPPAVEEPARDVLPPSEAPRTASAPQVDWQTRRVPFTTAEGRQLELEIENYNEGRWQPDLVVEVTDGDQLRRRFVRVFDGETQIEALLQEHSRFNGYAVFWITTHSPRHSFDVAIVINEITGDAVQLSEEDIDLTGQEFESRVLYRLDIEGPERRASDDVGTRSTSARSGDEGPTVFSTFPDDSSFSGERMGLIKREADTPINFDIPTEVGRHVIIGFNFGDYDAGRDVDAEMIVGVERMVDGRVKILWVEVTTFTVGEEATRFDFMDNGWLRVRQAGASSPFHYEIYVERDQLKVAVFIGGTPEGLRVAKTVAAISDEVKVPEATALPTPPKTGLEASAQVLDRSRPNSPHVSLSIQDHDQGVSININLWVDATSQNPQLIFDGRTQVQMTQTGTTTLRLIQVYEGNVIRIGDRFYQLELDLDPDASQPSLKIEPIDDPQSRPLGSLRHKRGFQENAARIFSRYFPSGTNYTQQFFIPSNEKEEYLSKREGQAPTDPGSISDAGARRERTEDERSSLLHHWNVIDFPHSRLEVVASSRQSGSWFSLLQRTSQAGGIHTGSVRIRITPTDGEGLPYLPGRRFQAQSRDIRVRRSSYEVVNIHGLAPIILMMDRRTGDVVPLSPSYWESLNDPHIFDETVAKMHHVYGVALRYGKSGRELKGSTQPAESGRVATSDLKVPPSKPQPPDAKPLPLPEVFGEDPSPDDPVEEWRFTEIEGGASLRKTQDGSWVHNFFDFFDKSGRRLDILVIEKGNKFYLHINVDGEGVTCRIHARSGNITLIQLDVASGPPLVLGFDRENERFLWVEPVVVTEEHAKPFIRPLERPLIPRLEDGQELTRDFPVGDQQAQVQLRVSFGMWQLPIVVNDGKPALRIILDGVEREILIEGNRQIDEGRIVVYELSGLGMALAVNRQSGEVVTVENTDLELGESGFISRVRYRFCEGGVGRSWPSSFLPWQLEDEGPTTDRPNLFILEPNPVPQEAPPAAQPPDAEAPEVEPSVTRELSPPLEPVAPPLTTPVELPAEAGAQAEVDPFADALAELDTIDRDVADEPDRFNTSQRAALDAAREAGLPEEVSAFVEVAFPSDGKELGVPAQRVHSLVFGQILPKVNPDVLDAAKEALGKAVALLSRLHSGGQKGFVAVPDSVADSIESIRQGFFSDLADYRAHQQLRRLPPGVSDLQTNGLPREAVRQEVIEVYRQAYPEAFARFSTTSEVDGESWTKFNEVLNYAIDAGVAIQPLLDGRNPYIGLSHEIAAQRFLASQAHLNQLLSEGFFKGETRQMLADLRASNQGFYAEHFDDVIALQAKIHTVPVGFGEHFQFHTTGRASYGHKGLILYEVLKALVVTAREPHFGTAGFLMAMADNFSHSMPQLAGFLAIDHTATQAFHLVGRGFSILRHADKVQIKMQESVFQQLIRGKPVTAMTAEGLKDWSLGLARSLFKPGLFTAVMTLEVIAIVNNKELRLLVDMQDEAVQEIASHEKTRRLMRAGVSGAMGFGSGVYVGTSVAAYVSGGAIGGTSASPLGTIAGTVIGLGVGFLVAEASGRAFDAVYAEFAGYDTKEDLIPELKRRLQQDYPIFSFEDSEIFTRLDQMQPKTWDEILHVYVEIKETLDAYHSLEYLVSQSGQDLISDYGIDQHPVSLARWDLVSGLDWLEAMDYLDVKKISLPFAALNFGTLFYLLAAALRRPPGHKELKLEPTGELDAYEMGRIVECELQTYLDGYGELDTELVQAVVVVDPNAMRFQAAVQKGKRTDYTVFDVMAELESNPAPHLRHYLYVGGPDGDETTFARQIIAALAGHDEKQDWIVKQAFDDQEGFFGFDGIKFGGTAFEVYDFVENGIRDFQIANPVKEELSDEYLAKIMWPKLHAWRPDLFVAEAPDYKEYPTLNILQSFSPGVEDQVSVQISYLAQQDLARREDAKKYLRGVITGDTIQNLLDIKLEDKEDKIKDETLDRNAKTALEMAQKGKFLAKTPIILRELLEAGRIIEASEIASAILENHPATKQAIDEKLLDPEVYTDFFDYDRQRVEAVWSAYGDLYKDEFESQFKKEVDPDLVEEWALRIFYERFIKNQFYHKTIDDVLEDDLIYARIPKEERTAYRHLTPEIAKLLWDQKTNAVRLPSEVVARVFSKNPGLKDEFGVLADPENLNFVNAYINGDYQTWSYDDPSESEDFTDEGRPVIEELLTRSAWDWSLEDFEALHEALVLGKQDLDYNHDEFYDLVCEVIEAHEDLRTLWGQEEVPDVLRHPELSELVSLYQVDWLLKNLEIMIFTERYEKSTVCNEDGYGQDADSDSDL